MANYYVLLTDHGKSFIANAQANTQLALTHVVLGDANDQPYLPESRIKNTALLHQTAKIPVASIKVINATTAEVSAVVPSNVGGFNVHEIGITDSSGKLVYIGNFHGGYRPTLTEGAGGDMELIFTIKAENLATVIIEMDGNVVSATREWVTDNFALKTLVQTLSELINELKEDLMATQFELLSQQLTALSSQLDQALNYQQIKIGDVYTTTINHTNAAAVNKHHGYGTWERLAEGRTLVGFSTKSSDPADYKTMGKEFGSNTHTLTLDESPSHEHTVDMHGGSIDGTTRAGTQNTSSSAANIKTSSVGGGQPHNNIQPSRVVGHWLRTA